MVYLLDGKISIPDDLVYSAEHLYLNVEKKRIGFDQIGLLRMKNPQDLEFLSTDEISIGMPLIKLNVEQGERVFHSPVTGKIKGVFKRNFSELKNDTYEEGYLIEFERIDDISKTLISGDRLEEWASEEIKDFIGRNYIFKIIEIGDSAVGKTAIKVRFTDDYFKQDLKSTMGVDFGSKEINVEFLQEDLIMNVMIRAKVKITVWDVAGQLQYKNQRGMFYQGARGCLLCYDVTNPLSFQNLKEWMKELEENLGAKVPVLLVGNKIDLPRKVSREEAEAFAKKNGYIYAEMSAKTGINVDNAFTQLAIEMIQKTEGNLV